MKFNNVTSFFSQRRHEATAAEREADAKRAADVTRTEFVTSRVNAELEKEARQQIIDYYEQLSAAAALRERRALWLARRRELNPRRDLFLRDEEHRLKMELEREAETVRKYLVFISAANVGFMF